MIDETKAFAEASKMFQDGWNSHPWPDASYGIGPKPLVLFEGDENEGKPRPEAKPFLRFTFEPLDGGRGSLAGDSGTRLYDRSGLIVVQSFGPLTGGKGMQIANYLSIIAKRVFEGKQSPNCMWFKNCRNIRIGPSGAWYQYNSIIEFTYNEVR